MQQLCNHENNFDNVLDLVFVNNIKNVSIAKLPAIELENPMTKIDKRHAPPFNILYSAKTKQE